MIKTFQLNVVTKQTIYKTNGALKEQVKQTDVTIPTKDVFYGQQVCVCV